MSIELLQAEDQAAVKEVLGAVDQSERLHRQYRTKWDDRYGLYRRNKDWRQQWRESERDRDALIRDAKREWGADLVIPYCFSVVETIVPRMLLHRPRMLILPRDKKAEHNVENMRLLIDAQQERIRYELRLQRMCKGGLIFGLGAGKMRWEYRVRKRKFLEPRLLLPGHHEVEREEVLADDWTFDPIDIRDFFWDPFGDQIEDLEWAAHRTWRSPKYVRKMIESGAWTLPTGFTLEDCLSLGPPTREYETIRRGRLDAAGMTDWTQGDHPHEVLEYHADDERVITVLDRMVPVQQGGNPAWHGELPFSTYRPMEALDGHLPGIGVIEMIEGLVEEMNVLRSQRRDAATIRLNPPMAYNDGAVEEEDIAVGPGIGIPVRGDPREVFHYYTISDIPGSSIQEELALQRNIEQASGISDPVTGASQVEGTATEAQIKLAAANERIKMMTLRMEQEAIARNAGQALDMNQQRIRKARPVTITDPHREGWHKTIEVGPDELAGRMWIVPDGGSTAPENVPQMRQDGLQLANLFRGNPAIDQRKLAKAVLEKFEVPNPDSWILPDEPRIPPKTLEYIVALAAEQGIPPEAMEQIVMAAGQIALEEEEAEKQDERPGTAPAEEPAEAPA